jgi:hypothetical protein
MTVGRRCWSDQRGVGPVRLVGRALADPFGEQRFLGFAERFLELRRRHEVVLILGVQAFEQQAGLGIAGHDGLGLDGRLAHIEAEVGFTMVFVGAVAGEAVVAENGTDVAVVAQLGRRSEGGRCGEGADERQEARRHHHQNT